MKMLHKVAVYLRVFHLRLKPDFEGFAEDFKVLSSNQSWRGDLSHIYSGVLEGTAKDT